MDLRLLRAFVVAEEKNFTRAAARLYLTQPALSRQVQALERQVGAPLFERSSCGAAPTAAGDVLLIHARGIISRLPARSRPRP